MTTSRLAVLLPLSLALLTAACGERVTTTSAGRESTAPPASPGEPLLQIVHVGGFLPVGADFSRVPQLTVYADGRAIVAGPQPAIFPPPALPNLLAIELDDDGVQQLVDLAEEAGLLAHPPDYGQPPIADAATTVVTLTVDGGTYEHSAYALGRAEVEGEPPAEALPGRSAAAGEARAALAGFVEAATSLVDNAGVGSGYEPQGLALKARAVPEGTDGGSGNGVEPAVVPWPLPEVELAGASECVVLEGQAADTLGAALLDANTLTRFEDDGVVYDVFARPLLPGEDGGAIC